MNEEIKDEFLQLVKLQAGIQETIQKSLINLKKDSENRKTENYAKVRLGNLKQYYDEYCINDSKIKHLQPATPEHPYWEDRLKVQQLHQQLREILENVLQNPADQITTHSVESDITSLQPPQASGSAINPTTTQHFKTAEFSPVENNRNYVPTKVSNEESDSQEKHKLLKKQNVLMRLMYRQLETIRTLLDENQIANELIHIKINQVSKDMAEIDQLHKTILCEIDEEEPGMLYFAENHYGNMQVSVEAVLVRLQRAVQNYNRSTEEPKAPRNVFNLKMPKLEIPVFYGDYETWSSFLDMFTKLVHENVQLSNIEKMTYLKSSLRKSAAQLVSHLSTTGDNYAMAWNIVNTRYNNNRVLAATYFNTLLTYSNIQTASAATIRTLHDTTVEILHNISKLNIKSTFEAFVMHILMKKLDSETIKLYESNLACPREIQDIEDFLTFLERRFQSLEAAGQGKPSVPRTSTAITTPRIHTKQVHTSTVFTQPCYVDNCKGYHPLAQCQLFMKMSTLDRAKLVNKENLCRRCLNYHGNNSCTIASKCVVCQGLHNTLLHGNNSVSTSGNGSQKSYLINQKGPVLLPTATLVVKSKIGKQQILRALIDLGSQASFICAKAVNQLGLPKTKTFAEISGIGSSEAGIARSKCEIIVQPRFQSNFQLSLEVIVLPKLTGQLPEQPISIKNNNQKTGQLADPNFGTPGPIDIILGADVFGDIIKDGIQKNMMGNLTGQNTEFGWILSGQTPSPRSFDKISTHVIKLDTEQSLKKFWEQEEVPEQQQLSEDDKICEKLYIKTVQRSEGGRYIVSLPFKPQINSQLGQSKNRAMHRFFQLEKKFEKNPTLKEKYVIFMNEYKKLFHMEKVTSSTKDIQSSYYLPHHAVFKHGEKEQKIRVVFDASARTTTGISLNDRLLTGPKIQQDLWSIMSRWRKHRIVFVADIEKMYRQILITQEHQDYQRIFWRDATSKPLEEYNLKTVTYGTSAAPFLAIRTLMQLAHDYSSDYPAAAEVLTKDFYVDDVLTGAETIDQALEIQLELTSLLSQGGFKLSKWASNNGRLLQHKRLAEGNIELDPEHTIKTLGVHWCPATDTWGFKVNVRTVEKCTKRIFLSESSKQFDPLGWLSPIIILTKQMYQELWQAGIDWDHEIPKHIQKKWDRFKHELRSIEEITLPRWIGFTPNCLKAELHGFCDASEKAYAAVIYSRIHLPNNEIIVRLLAAKTRVAPTKTKLTLPRLELQGALLLTKLVNNIHKAVDINFQEIHAWCDSQIVLAWLQGQPSRWKTFVANRVAEIQSSSLIHKWHYVSSINNPADCASRGIFPADLKSHPLWWSGPPWLQKDSQLWPIEELKYKNHHLEEKRIVSATSIINNTEPFLELITRLSKFGKIKRVIAYCKRFINKLSKKQSYTNWLTTIELRDAEIIVLKSVQETSFSNDLAHIRNNSRLNNQSKLLSLNPVLDENGVLRVRGRIQNSAISYDAKQPIILPKRHLITTMIIEEAHQRTLHGGCQLTLNYLRKKYWILNGRDIVRYTLQKCIKCHRYKQQGARQLMGDLPKARVTPARPFARTGIDYAGPIQLRTTKGRGHKSYKGYIAIFICMATKAIHIEIVSDMTVQGFISAYKRFTSRRGLCTDIYSDNGTYFVGANTELQKERKRLIQKLPEDVAAMVANDETTWHFIPPTASHFGGIWEAGVKSIKHHLKRIIGDTTLTFEEITTLTAQIEACLNSRPITPISNDPSDLSALTPGHFLIGGPILAAPYATLAKVSLGTRWQLVQNMTHHFWKRWSSEYLHQLQQRPKWQRVQPNLQIGQLVLLKDDSLPPTRWKLGRIMKLHIGADNLARVASVKCQNGMYKRPIVKLSPLPMPTIESSDLEPIVSNNSDALSAKSTVTRQQPGRKVKRINALQAMHSLTCPSQSVSLYTHQEVPISSGKIVGKKLESQSSQLQDNQCTIGRGKHKGQYPRYLSNIIILLLTLGNINSTLSTHIRQPFKISAFDQPPGIFFDNLGEAELLASSWKIIVQYNMADYWKELENIRTSIEHLRSACNHGYADNEKYKILKCDLIIQQLDWQFKNINNANELLLVGGKRSKRDIGNTIGKVMGDMFGILSQREAEEYEEHFDNIQKNENHLMELMKNQTSIIDNTVQLFKHNSEFTNNQLNVFKTNMLYLSDQIDNVAKHAAIQDKVQSITSLSIQLMLVLKHIEDSQKALKDVIYNTHPSLLTPNQLRAELIKIKNNIPPTINIPGGNSVDDLRRIYNTMTFKTRITEKNIIVRIEVPLVHNHRYKMFALIPVPVPIKNYQRQMVPTSNYFIMDMDHEHFAPVNDRQFKSCIIGREHHYICDISPIYTTHSNACLCEVSMMMRKVNPHSTCNFKNVSVTSSWIRLNRPNHWIFVLNEEINVDLVCENYKGTITLKNSGMIVLESACSLRDATFQLAATSSNISQVIESFIPTLNISDEHLMTTINEGNEHRPNAIIRELFDLNLNKSSNLDLNITELLQFIQQQKESERLPTNIDSTRFHHTHHYVMIHVIFWTLVTIGICVIIRYIQQRRRQPCVNEPIPLPRRRVSVESLRR